MRPSKRRDLSWSTGPVEGHINRLKMLKRQMFGRARLDLLSRRFLGAPREGQAQAAYHVHVTGARSGRVATVAPEAWGHECGVPQVCRGLSNGRGRSCCAVRTNIVHAWRLSREEARALSNVVYMSCALYTLNTITKSGEDQDVVAGLQMQCPGQGISRKLAHMLYIGGCCFHDGCDHSSCIGSLHSWTTCVSDDHGGC